MKRPLIETDLTTIRHALARLLKAALVNVAIHEAEPNDYVVIHDGVTALRLATEGKVPPPDEPTED